MGEKDFFRAGRAPSQAEGAPLLLRGRRHGQNGASSRYKGASASRRGAVYALKGAIVGERALFRFIRAPSLAGRRPYNAFGAKIGLGLRYLANGDEKLAPLRLRRRGASFHWGGAASPCSPPLDPPLSLTELISALFL